MHRVVQEIKQSLLSVHVCLSICPLSVCPLSVCLSVSLSVCLSVHHDLDSLMTQSCTRQSQCKYLYVTENVYVYTHVMYMYMKVAEVPKCETASETGYTHSRYTIFFSVI